MSVSVVTPGPLSVGDAVIFDRRPGRVVEAGPVRRSDLTGERSQTITVETYAGRHMIGTMHSALFRA